MKQSLLFSSSLFVYFWKQGVGCGGQLLFFVLGLPLRPAAALLQPLSRRLRRLSSSLDKFSYK